VNEDSQGVGIKDLKKKNGGGKSVVEESEETKRKKEKKRTEKVSIKTKWKKV
jgi:hypothetical protein